VPVLACADALKADGATVDLVTAGSDDDIDAAVKPVEAGEVRLILAAATDAEVRAVVRRMVRHLVPPPSKRPVELPPNRTIFDLPPLSVLPLVPAVPPLSSALSLPITPADVAAATLGGRERRLDLLRNDAGSVTLHGCLFGGLDDGQPAVLRARIETDDTVLTDGDETVLACAVRNVGASDVDGLPLVVEAAPDDGLVDVAVAVPVLRRRLVRSADVRIEVRRARGRGMSVTPRDGDIRCVDDGVVGPLTRKTVVVDRARRVGHLRDVMRWSLWGTAMCEAGSVRGRCIRGSRNDRAGSGE
jgi:NAD(P)-dependent dehydrogenase (short-subunit alcohol dehydrogenase family)